MARLIRKNPDYVLREIAHARRLLDRLERDYRLAFETGITKRSSGLSDRITGSLDHDEVASIVVENESARDAVAKAAGFVATAVSALDSADAAVSRVVGKPDGPKTRDAFPDESTPAGRQLKRAMVNDTELADAREAQRKRRRNGEE